MGYVYSRQFRNPYRHSTLWSNHETGLAHSHGMRGARTVCDSHRISMRIIGDDDRKTGIQSKKSGQSRFLLHEGGREESREWRSMVLSRQGAAREGEL